MMIHRNAKGWYTNVQCNIWSKTIMPVIKKSLQLTRNKVYISKNTPTIKSNFFHFYNSLHLRFIYYLNSNLSKIHILLNVA